MTTDREAEIEAAGEFDLRPLETTTPVRRRLISHLRCLARASSSPPSFERPLTMDDLSAAVEQWSETLQFIDDNMPAELPEGVGDPIFPPTRCVSILVTARDAADLHALLTALDTQRAQIEEMEREKVIRDEALTETTHWLDWCVHNHYAPDSSAEEAALRKARAALRGSDNG